MVMKLRRCFFLKSKAGLWALIHSHDSGRGPDMTMRVFWSFPAACESWERTDADSVIFEEMEPSD